VVLGGINQKELKSLCWSVF